MPGSTRDNTAVTRLIDEANQRPLETDDALFEAPRKPSLPPPFRARGQTAASPPVVAPPEPMPYRAPTGSRREPAEVSAPPPIAAAPGRALSEHDVPTRPFDSIEADGLEDEHGASDVDVDVEEPAADLTAETFAAPEPRWEPAPSPLERTQIAQMPRSRRAWAKDRSLIWIAGAFVLGLAATAAIAWPRGAKPPAPAPTVVSSVNPAPAPSVVAVPVAVPVAEPVAAPVAEPVAEPVAVAETEPVAGARPKPAPSRAAKPKPPASKPAPRVAAAAANTATLMIGSKPPCKIVIDGRKTGLTTPQRAIKVSPGPHQVMFVNDQYRIYITFPVTAVAGKSVKLIKDLTSKMKR